MRARARLFAVGVLLTLAGLGGVATGAQRTAPIRIGALTESWGPTPAIIGLRDGLAELGYREEKDFVIGVRFTQGNAAELPAAARDLVKHGVDLIVTSEAGTSAQAAQTATDRIPIVFLGASDPVGMRLVRSLAHPGANITGIASLDSELVPKRMQIFREIVPGLKRILLPYDATSPFAVEQLTVYRAAARQFGLTLVERPVRSQEEARATILGVRKGDVDGIFSHRLLSLNIPGFILEVGAKGIVPTMFHAPFWVEHGGLASYSTGDVELGRQGARLVDKILRGARPADLPVEQPTKFELAVNRKTARALGLTIPPSLLLRADQVIE